MEGGKERKWANSRFFLQHPQWATGLSKWQGVLSAIGGVESTAAEGGQSGGWHAVPGTNTDAGRHTFTLTGMVERVAQT